MRALPKARLHSCQCADTNAEPSVLNKNRFGQKGSGELGNCDPMGYALLYP